jgi:hypothetical protein
VPRRHGRYAGRVRLEVRPDHSASWSASLRARSNRALKSSRMRGADTTS